MHILRINFNQVNDAFGFMFTNARHSRPKSAEFRTLYIQKKNPGLSGAKRNVRIGTQKTRKRFEINTATMGSHSSYTSAQDFAVSSRFPLDIFSTHDDTRTPDSTLCFRIHRGPLGVFGSFK